MCVFEMNGRVTDSCPFKYFRTVLKATPINKSKKTRTKNRMMSSSKFFIGMNPFKQEKSNNNNNWTSPNNRIEICLTVEDCKKRERSEKRFD